MTLKKKHVLLFLVLIFTLLFGVTMASATTVDDNNYTTDVIDNNGLSTPTDYAVDNVVQSDTTKISTDADVEKITTDSDATNDKTEKTIKTEKTETATKTITKSTEVKAVKTGRNVPVYTESDITTALSAGGDIDFVLQNDIVISNKLANNLNNKIITFEGRGHTISGSSNDKEFMMLGQGMTINFNNITFTNFKQIIYTDNACDLTMENCQVIDNTAVQQGLVKASSGNIVIRDSVIANNRGSEGTFIHSAGATVLVDNCTIENNSASSRGGVLYGSSGTITIQNSVLKNNSVTGGNGGGGVAYSDSANIVLINNSISNNSANVKGAVVTTNNAGVNVTLINNTIENHTVSELTQQQYPNSVIYVMDGNVECSGNVINNNTALGNANIFTCAGTTNLTNNTITNNKAAKGSVFALFKTFVNVTGNYIGGNIITEISDNSFVINFHSGNGDLPPQGVEIIDNEFNNNTYVVESKYVDILISDFNGNLEIHDNRYVHNALNVTGWDITDKSEDANNFYINVSVHLRSIYNDTVRNGTITLYDGSGNPLGTYKVVNGTCNITLPKSQVPGVTLNEITAEYKSYFKHYQYYDELKFSRITVNANPNPVTVENTVIISGKLFDASDENKVIEGATITITIGNDVFYTTTNSTGEYSLENVTATTGNKNVKAEFNVDLGYEYSYNETTFSVIDQAQKIPTEIEIEYTAASGLEVFKPIEITLTLTNTSDPKEAVSGKHLNVTINGVEYDVSEYTTDDNGQFTFTYTPQNVNNLTVVAIFYEDDDYAGSSNSIEIKDIALAKPTLEARVSSPTIYVGDSETIVGTLKYGDTPIANALVNVTINGEQISGTGTNGEWITDENGQISFMRVNQPYNDTPYYVNLHYEGLASVYAGADAQTQYNVIKYPSKLVITPIEHNSVEINVPFEVTVTLTNGTDVNKPLVGKNLTVKVNNELIDLGDNVTDENGVLKFTYTAKNNTPLTFEAWFEGDNIFNASYAKEDYTDKIPLLNSFVTVDVTPQTILVNDSVLINGTLMDSQGNYIKNANVTLKIDNNVFTTVLTDDEGKYSYTLTSANETHVPYLQYKDNSYKVTVSYAGEPGVILGDAASEDYIVVKMPTTLEISPLESGSVEIDTPFIITVTLKNNTGIINEETGNTNPIAGKEISVKVNGVPVVFEEGQNVTDANGQITFSYTVNNNNGIIIDAQFIEDWEYQGSTANYVYPYDISLLNSELNLSVNRTSIYVNDSNKINGTLYDSRGNPIKQADVIITIDDEDVATLKTNDYGEFELELSIDDETKVKFLQEKDVPYSVLARYAGEPGVILGNSSYATYKVTRMPTSLAFDDIPAGTVVINVPFEVTLTLTNDTDNNNPLEGKNLTVKVNNELVDLGDKVTDDTGVLKFNYTATTNAPLTFEAWFEGDAIYQGSSAREVYNYNIALLNSFLTADVRQSPVYVNDTVEIYGTLIDSQGNNISGANLNIIIDNVEVINVTTDQYGNYSFTMTSESENYLQFLRYKENPYLVSVMYRGKDAVILGTVATTTYTVQRVPTTVEISVADKVDNGTEVTITAQVISGEDKYNPMNYPNNFTFNIDGEETTVDVNDGIATITYQATEIKFVNVTGKFGPNELFDANQDSKLFEVIDVRTPTNATIEVEGVRYAKETFDVTITLRNDTANGQVIPNQDVIVNITITGEEGVNSTPYRTDENGQIKFKYTPENIHNVTITVSYDGNTTFKPCINETTVKAELMPSTITVDVDPNPSNVNQSVVISGKLYDLVENISDASVKIKINSETVKTVKTDENGEYSYTVTSEEWDKYLAYSEKSYVVQVVYDYVLDVTNGADNLTTYRVVKIPTKLEIEDITDAKVNETLTIKVNLTNQTEPAEVINNKAIKITVNGQPIDTSSLRTENGIISVDYTPKDNSTLYITAEFTEDEIYAGSQTDKEVTVGLIKPTLTCNANDSAFYVDESVNITGKLSNGNTPITNAIIKLYINDAKVISVVTDDNGEYSHVVRDLTEGTYTVKAVFDGNENVLDKATSEPDEYVVSRIPTVTEVTVVNNTVGNVTIEVVVRENVPGEYENVITSGQLNITIGDGDVTTKSIDGATTTIKLTDITETGDVKVNVTFNGSYKYEESTASDSANPEDLITIPVEALATNVTITVDPDPQTCGQSVTISGEVIDDLGNVIDSGKVYIIVNDGSEEEVPFSGGQYSHSYTTSIVGVNDVTVKFAGTENLTGSTNKTTFNVDRIPTTTIVTVLNSTAGNVTIDVVVTNKTGEPVTEGQFEVTVAGKTLAPIDIQGENTTVKLDITEVGDIQVSVKYLGTDIYEESMGIDKDTIPDGGKPEDGEVLEEITTEIQQSTITVIASPDQLLIGETETITGQLLDGMGNPIGGAFVTISLNGKETIVRTNENGKYNLTDVPTKNGTVEVVVTYDGNSSVNGSSNKASYDVDKKATITLVSVKNNTAGNVSIDVEVKDKKEGKNVTTGQLEVTTPSGKFTVDVSGEVTNIPLDLEAGVHEVSVKYLENEVYKESEGLNKTSYEENPENPEGFSEITVVTQNTTLTVEVESPIKVGENSTISGKLVDSQNKPIEGAKIVVTVEGKDEPLNATTDVNGEFSVTYENATVGTHEVVCSYAGNGTFNGTTETKNIEVQKLGAQLSADDIGNVPIGSEANITGKLLDEKGRPIADAIINITVDGQKYFTTTDSEGNYNKTVPVNRLGEIPVTIEYTGDANYSAAEPINRVINAVKVGAEINVVVPDNATVNKNTTITGTVTDEEGTPLEGVNLTVKVNGKEYNTTTERDGSFTVEVDNVAVGLNNVTVSIKETDDVEAEPVEDKFIGNRQNTNLTVNPVEDVPVGSNATITGTLTDDEGNPIKDAAVVVYVGDRFTTVTTDGNGNYNAQLPVDTLGEVPVTVKYEGNEIYNPSEKETSINVVPVKAEIAVEMPENATVNKPAEIKGNVTDEDGNPIPNVPVTVTVNGEEYPTITDENGTFTIEADNVVVGENTVKAEVTDETIDADPAEGTFDADKQATELTVDEVPDAKLGDNVTITGQLTDDEGKPIAGADVTVTVGDETKTVITDSEGNYVAELPVNEMGDVPVKVEYDGNGTYKAAEPVETTVYVGKADAVIDVVMPTDAVVNKNTTVNGSVTDDEGNPLAGIDVTVTVNGKDFTAITEDDGSFTVDVDNVVVGLNNVTVTITDDEYEAEPVEDKFIGNRQDTNLTVTPVGEVPVGDVTITGKLTDDEGNPIANAPVTVFVGDRFKDVITDDEGNYEAVLPVDTLGEVPVTVKYEGNEIYNPSEKETSINVVPVKAEIAVEMPENATVNKPAEIKGNVTDEDGNPIPNVPVTVTVNGEEYPTITDENGTFTIEADNVVVGENTVKAEVTDENIDADPAEGTFDADRQDTELTVDEVPEATVGENATVTGKLTDDEGNPIPNADITVTVDGKEYPATTDDEGNFVVDVPVDKVGEIPVEVDYAGNDTYKPAHDDATINVVPVKADINVEVPENATVNKPTEITGNVTDEDGNPLPDVPVTVTVNGKEYNTTTDENGTFTVPVDNVVPGLNNVTVTVDDENIEADPVDDDFLGNRQDTELTVDPVEDVPVGSNATITGKLTDDEGNPIANAPVDVIVGDRIKSVITDDEGNYEAVLPVDELGEIPVTVKYHGNETYNPSEKEGTINVVPVKANITVEVPENATVNKPVEIKGNVTGEDGNPIPNVPVNVTVNGETYPAVTDENGTYTVPVDNVVVGDNNVTVTVDDENVVADPVKETFPADRQDAELIVDEVPETTVGENATVTGKLTDDEGNPIPNADITVTVDGKEYPATTDDEGNFVVDVPVDKVGEIPVEVDYAGNDTYKPAHDDATINVVPVKADINMEVPENATANKPTEITGNVTDEDGNPLPDVPVTVTVNGKEYNTTTDENGTFTVPVDNVEPGLNNVTVTVDDENIEADPVKDKFLGDKQDTELTVDPIPDTKVGENATITGKLTDDEGKPIANAEIEVTVNGETQTVTTDKDGNYEATVPVDKVGEIPVKVEFAGDDTYNPAKVEDTLNAVKVNANIDVEVPENATVNKPVEIKGNVTDEDGNPIPNVPVNVTVNGETYPAVTDENGTFTVPVDNVVVGDNNVTVTVDDENVVADPVKETFPADKDNAILTVDPIPDTNMGDKPVITGKLTDEDGNPIKDAEVTITVNGETYTVTTDDEGNYELEVSNITVGENNVSVSFEDENYNPTTTNTSFDVTKLTTIVTVEPVYGIVGEDITLIAHVKDENGNDVTGGNLAFKLNGRTLRTDGRFDSDAPAMKFKVVDGLVTFTMKADLYLRAGKNVSASYSGSYKYDAAKSEIAEANIKKRNAQVEVTVVPNPAKQDSQVVFSVKLRDVTKGGTNTTCITTDANLILKINGVSLKDENGQILKVPVEDTVTNYVYTIPRGTAGIYKNGTIRDYTVMAVYNNSMFYPDTRNTTTYNVNRSIVNVNFKSTTVKDDVLSLKATLTDYENFNLVGESKICLKINGKTYQENGETKYFTVKDGNVDLTGIKLDSGTKVKSVTLVAGDREAYLSARETTTDITTS